MQNTVTVKDRQTAFDIAIQESGTIESVFDFARNNGLMSITDLLIVGSEVKPAPIAVKENVDYYLANELYPASDDVEQVKKRGINYDHIGHPDPVIIVYPNP